MMADRCDYQTPPSRDQVTPPLPPPRHRAPSRKLCAPHALVKKHPNGRVFIFRSATVVDHSGCLPYRSPSVIIFYS